MNCTSYDLPQTAMFPDMPSATTAQMPTMIGTTQSNLPPVQPRITAQYLLQRLPQIVNPEPAVVDNPACGGFTNWVNDNPLWAAVGLGFLALWAFGSKK